MLSHDNMLNWFRTNFSLMQLHDYSISELENMMPWERKFYIDLLQRHLKDELERKHEEYAQKKNAMNAVNRPAPLSKQFRRSKV